MEKNILYPDYIKKFFIDNGYKYFKPFSIINNQDTVFISAGIQPLLKSARENQILDCEKVYLPQPVIRTQYSESIEEGSSIAFTNVTTATFNNSEEEHLKMVKDWYNFLNEIGISKNNISTLSDVYETRWDDLDLIGKRTFHYYNNLEIGDTTFFSKIAKNGKSISVKTMSDLGFGLERLRWRATNKSYYNLYNKFDEIDLKVKAYLSALALLAVNEVKPSNKNAGYRVRLFSKKLINIIEGRSLNVQELKYLEECIIYWKLWQEKDYDNKEIIINELTRNGNRFILDMLSEEGYKNLTGININISREEFNKRLRFSGVPEERIKKLIRYKVLK